MNLVLTGGAVLRNGSVQPIEMEISQGRIVSISSTLSKEGKTVIELHNHLIVPGFVDVHVHLRQPGFSYKETIASGTAAAAAGGYTAVCAMPNLKPVPDCLENLQEELNYIQKDARIHVYPFGAITCGEKGETIADFAAMAPYVCGWSDDGRGVQSDERMRRAMELAKTLDKPIVAHCEDESLLTPGWRIHDGAYAHAHNLIGNNPESEWRQVERDIGLVRETGCRYHVCHVSTKESLTRIRAAKAEGLPVSCETAPHYLLLCDDDLQDDGRFKMNPPLRTAADRDALVEALVDGTIDCIATDHAPHSAAEKSGGLHMSLNGIVGLETAFPVLYTKLVKTGIVSLTALLNALCVNPRRLFGLPGGEIAEGQPADLTILDLDCPHVIDSADFLSMSRSTPFDGWNVSAAVHMTLCDGEIVYQEARE